MQNRRWLRRTTVVLVVLLLADTGFAWLLRTRWTHAYLSARLAETFGRPMEVSRFDFSLLGGPRLEAELVTVAEEPRFGHEYFLRAERLTASLRWKSLARGRFEFGTLSFTRPSLNLVRTADGYWNVESWLPPPAPAQRVGAGSSRSLVALRLFRIEIDAGRINFKRGVDKHSLSLGDVKGLLEQESPGRWRLDLEARPLRAAVVLQESGTLRVRGRIGGTSTRLQPAELVLTWREASLADALRLVRGHDFGVRGRLVVELTARSERPSGRIAPVESAAGAGEGDGYEPRWLFGAAARLDNVHRWDLPARVGNPALNVSLEAQWRPSQTRVEISQCVFEAPRSNIIATGRIQWAQTLDPEFRFLSSGISLADLLSWYRAFRPGVAENLSLNGDARVDFVLGGWPPRLKQGTLTSSGARLSIGGVPGPVRVGRVVAHARRGRIELEPTQVFLRNPPGEARGTQRQDHSLRIKGALQLGESLFSARGRNAPFEIHLEGQTDRAQDLLVAAQAFGHTLHHGWSMEGPADLRLRWQGGISPFSASAWGEIGLRGLLLHTSFLNQPVTLANARIELRPREQRVTLTAAQALGARWSGSLWKRFGPSPDAVQPWEFDLSADRLDAVELDRWLGPRARAGLLGRLVPFTVANASSSQRDVSLSRLRGRGQLTVVEFVVSPVRVHRLRATTVIEGRKIIVHRARGEFYKGIVSGSLSAELSAQPLYRLRAQFDRVDLGPLAGATETLKDHLTGVASGELTLAARGVGRMSLLQSLEGHGAIKVRRAAVRGLDLEATHASQALRHGISQFASAEARFSIAAGNIRVERLDLSGSEEGFEAEGNVSFSGTLELEVRRRPRFQNERLEGGTVKAVRIAGPLGTLQVFRPQLKTPSRVAQGAHRTRR